MDKISAFIQRNPIDLAHQIGQRLRETRLAKGWTQEELAERSGLAPSTLKLLESKGQGSLQRLIRVAIALDIDEQLRSLFATPLSMDSIESAKRSERQRAPRRKGNGEANGA